MKKFLIITMFGLSGAVFIAQAAEQTNLEMLKIAQPYLEEFAERVQRKKRHHFSPVISQDLNDTDKALINLAIDTNKVEQGDNSISLVYPFINFLVADGKQNLTDTNTFYRINKAAAGSDLATILPILKTAWDGINKSLTEDQKKSVNVAYNAFEKVFSIFYKIFEGEEISFQNNDDDIVALNDLDIILTTLPKRVLNNKSISIINDSDAGKALITYFNNLRDELRLKMGVTKPQAKEPILVGKPVEIIEGQIPPAPDIQKLLDKGLFPSQRPAVVPGEAGVITPVVDTTGTALPSSLVQVDDIGEIAAPVEAQAALPASAISGRPFANLSNDQLRNYVIHNRLKTGEQFQEAARRLGGAEGIRTIRQNYLNKNK